MNSTAVSKVCIQLDCITIAENGFGAGAKGRDEGMKACEGMVSL